MSENSRNLKYNSILISFFELIKNKSIITLILIGLVGLTIRIYYFPFDIPIVYDGIDYFSYAVVVSQQWGLPNGWNLSNNGWPIFLSLFFSVFDSQNYLDFIYLQRSLTIIISVLTIIPVYLLCNRFVEKPFAIMGAALFAFEPRIILHSLLGIPESSFIFLGTFVLFFFLSKRFSIILISFALLGLFTIVRYEGFLILIPFLVIFLIRFRNDEKIVQKMFFLIATFILIVSPIAYTMNEVVGDDSIVSPIFGGGINYLNEHIIRDNPDVDDPIYNTKNQQNKVTLFFTLGLVNLTKFLGWVQIPTFIAFSVLGFFLLLKKKDYKTVTVLVFGFTMLIPTFYLYGRGIEETKYLYILFPIFCLMSSLSIKKINEIINMKKLIVIILSAILISSIIFIEYKKIDYEYEKESYLVAKEIDNIAGGINHWSQWKYIPIAQIANDWPKIPLPDETGYNQEFNMKRVDAKNYSTIIEYLESSKEKGLTHLVIDEMQQPKFLIDVFNNEKEFPYLIKEYDSLDEGFKHQVKIYKIDYELFYEFVK